MLHHVTWSINSICHVIGERPFDARDQARNVWPLAVLSFGRVLAQPAPRRSHLRRHGVLRGQLDASARLIWMFEKLGWATDVRWPRPERLGTG